MKKYVVTGGAGFIGSTLVRTLVDAGGDVHVIDNLRSGHKKNLHGVPAALHEADIRDGDAIRPLIEGADTVFHLAAIPPCRGRFTNPGLRTR